MNYEFNLLHHETAAHEGDNNTPSGRGVKTNKCLNQPVIEMPCVNCLYFTGFIITTIIANYTCI